jgi:hypothetical protein
MGRTKTLGILAAGFVALIAFGAMRMRPIPTGVKQGKAGNLYKPAKEFYDEKEQVDAARRV